MTDAPLAESLVTIQGIASQPKLNGQVGYAIFVRCVVSQRRRVICAEILPYMSKRGLGWAGPGIAREYVRKQFE